MHHVFYTFFLPLVSSVTKHVFNFMNQNVGLGLLQSHIIFLYSKITSNLIINTQNNHLKSYKMWSAQPKGNLNLYGTHEKSTLAPDQNSSGSWVFYWCVRI